MAIKYNGRYVLKKILFLFVFLLFSPAFAINWVELTTQNDKTVYLDTDSIKEHNGYYFYNIHNLTSPDVLTIQSSINRSLAAKIDTIGLSTYNGDYQNITKNMTKKLEPVSYASIVYTCHKKVKEIMQSKKAIEIVE